RPAALIIHILSDVKIDRPSGIRTHPLQKPLADEHKGHAWESLNTFSGRTCHHIDVRPSDIQRLPRERTDRVQNKYPVLTVDDIRDLLDRIDKSGRSLVVDHCDSMRF